MQWCLNSAFYYKPHSTSLSVLCQMLCLLNLASSVSIRWNRFFFTSMQRRYWQLQLSNVKQEVLQRSTGIRNGICRVAGWQMVLLEHGEKNMASPKVGSSISVEILATLGQVREALKASSIHKSWSQVRSSQLQGFVRVWSTEESQERAHSATVGPEGKTCQSFTTCIAGSKLNFVTLLLSEFFHLCSQWLNW